MLNSMQPVALKVSFPLAQVNEAVPGMVVGAAALVIAAGWIVAGKAG